MAKTTTYLNVYTNIVKTLALKLVNNYSKCRMNLILPQNKLTEDCRPTIHIAFVVFGLQWYIRYYNSILDQ